MSYDRKSKQLDSHDKQNIFGFPLNLFGLEIFFEWIIIDHEKIQFIKKHPVHCTTCFHSLLFIYYLFCKNCHLRQCP